MNIYKLLNKLRTVRSWYNLRDTEQALYYELVALCNQGGWKDSFWCTNQTLAASLNKSDKTITAAREKLIKARLVSYRKGSSVRTPSLYSISIDLDTKKPLPEKLEDFPTHTGNTTATSTPNTTGNSNGNCTGKTDHANNNNKYTTDKDINSEELFLIFEEFRKEYPGTKRGGETEFTNFTKQHSDYSTEVHKLLPAIRRLKKWRQIRLEAGKFVPEYPILSTWINQRRWEEELNNTNNENYETNEKGQAVVN